MSLAELESRMKKWLTGEYAAHLFELNTAVIGYALYRRILIASTFVSSSSDLTIVADVMADMPLNGL